LRKNDSIALYLSLTLTKVDPEARFLVDYELTDFIDVRLYTTNSFARQKKLRGKRETRSLSNEKRTSRPSALLIAR